MSTQAQEDSLQVQAGEGTDNAVAEKVMGWKYAGFCRRSAVWIDQDGDEREFSPSQFIADAWEVVENMVGRMGWENPSFSWGGPSFKPPHRYMSSNTDYGLGTTCWYVRVTCRDHLRTVCADTPDLAVCRAALFVAETEREYAKRS